MLFEITERGTPFKTGEIIEIETVTPSLVNKGRIIANVLPKTFEVSTPDVEKKRGRPRKDAE